MNLLLLQSEDFISPTQAWVSGRRCAHIKQVLKAQRGDTLTVGALNGKIGHAKIHAITNECIELEILNLNSNPPATLPLTLILGLPRPRMLHRTLQTIATMGVEKLILIQSARVEKSFWQTPLLKPEAIHENLILGLEQGKATQLPQVELHQRFRPFMEDELPKLLESHQHRLIAHPGDYPRAKPLTTAKALLAIGPEGGFQAQEVSHFQSCGFQAIQLGERILRVETAIPVLLAKLY